MKDLITREPGPILAYYDANKELRLQVNTSKYGLGAVLMQDGHPIAYASKTLTPTEVNYAQFEKELFAVLFGCKRFHTYIIWQKDHCRVGSQAIGGNIEESNLSGPSPSAPHAHLAAKI